jgi:hypothetical protein
MNCPWTRTDIVLFTSLGLLWAFELLCVNRPLDLVVLAVMLGLWACWFLYSPHDKNAIPKLEEWARRQDANRRQNVC